MFLRGSELVTQLCLLTRIAIFSYEIGEAMTTVAIKATKAAVGNLMMIEKLEACKVLVIDWEN